MNGDDRAEIRHPTYALRVPVRVDNFALMDLIFAAIDDPEFDAAAWYDGDADWLETLARMIREGHARAEDAEEGGETT